MANSHYTKDLRTMTMSMGMGKNVKDTKQLSGEASKDSLHGGPNKTTEFRPKSGTKGPYGGEAVK